MIQGILEANNIFQGLNEKACAYTQTVVKCYFHVHWIAVEDPLKLLQLLLPGDIRNHTGCHLVAVGPTVSLHWATPALKTTGRFKTLGVLWSFKLVGLVIALNHVAVAPYFGVWFFGLFCSLKPLQRWSKSNILLENYYLDHCDWSGAKSSGWSNHFIPLLPLFTNIQLLLFRMQSAQQATAYRSSFKVQQGRCEVCSD